MATLVGTVFDEYAHLAAGDCDPVTAIGSSVAFTHDYHPGPGDTVAGTSGNDLYFINNASEHVSEAVGGGTDLVVSTVSYTLDDNVEHLLLTGSGNISGTGNGGDNVITGNTGNNVLSGAAGNDFIVAGGGNDFLDGGTGNDTLCAG